MSGTSNHPGLGLKAGYNYQTPLENCWISKTWEMSLASDVIIF